MADKMMRVAGRGNDGLAKALKTDNNGVVYTKSDENGIVNLLDFPTIKAGYDAGYFPASNRIFTTDIVGYKNNIYAAIGRKVIIYSNDGGETWQETNVAPDRLATSVWAWYNPFLLAVDESGYISPPGTVYCCGIRYLSTPEAGNHQVIWKLLPGETAWTETVAPLAEYIGEPSGFGVSPIGLVMVSRKGGRVAGLSANGGANWTKYTFDASIFDDHVHDCYCSPYHPTIYVSGGDDPASGKGGVMKTTDFVNWTRVIPEYPGYRIVPIGGNARRRFFGVEAMAGSVLIASLDDTANNIEVVMGRDTWESANFRTIKTSIDGLLVYGTYQYDNPPNSVKASNAGSLLISEDDGHTFKRLKLNTGLVSGVHIASKYIIVGGGFTDGGAAEYKHFPYITLINRAKISAMGYERMVSIPSWMPGYDSSDQNIAPTVGTLTVNMKAYTNIKLFLNITTAGTVNIQGRFQHDTPLLTSSGWVTLATKTYESATQEVIDLSAFSNFNLFRVVNGGAGNIRILEAIFTGELP